MSENLTETTNEHNTDPFVKSRQPGDVKYRRDVESPDVVPHVIARTTANDPPPTSRGLALRKLEHERTVMESLASSLDGGREMVAVSKQFFQLGRSTCHKRVETLEHAGVMSPRAWLGQKRARNRHNRVSRWGDVAGSGALKGTFRDAVKRSITLQIAQRHANINVDLDRSTS